MLSLPRSTPLWPHQPHVQMPQTSSCRGRDQQLAHGGRGQPLGQPSRGVRVLPWCTRLGGAHAYSGEWEREGTAPLGTPTHPHPLL